MTSEELSIDEALAMIAEGDKVHTLLGMFGADWDRPSLEQLVRTTSCRRKAGGTAAAMGHKLAVVTEDGKWLYVQTKAASHAPIDLVCIWCGKRRSENAVGCSAPDGDGHFYNTRERTTLEETLEEYEALELRYGRLLPP